MSFPNYFLSLNVIFALLHKEICGDAISYYDIVLGGGASDLISLDVLENTHTKNHLGCMNICHRTPNCISFFFNPSTNQCTLMSNLVDPLSEMLKSGDIIYGFDPTKCRTGPWLEWKECIQIEDIATRKRSRYVARWWCSSTIAQGEYEPCTDLTIQVQNCTVPEPEVTPYDPNLNTSELQSGMHFYSEAHFLNNGSWSILSDGRIIQRRRSAPTYAIYAEEFTTITLEGIVRVTVVNDDLIGWAISYRNNKLFYLITWKQGTQRLATKGVKVLMLNFTGQAYDPQLTWDALDTPDGTLKVLRKDSSDPGWEANVYYKFKIIHNPGDGLLRVIIRNRDTNEVVIDTENEVYDTNLQGGRFGLYSAAQAGVEWSNLAYNYKIDCQMSEWNNWGSCSENCGEGVQQRHRIIISQPVRGGNACTESIQQNQFCNLQPC